MEERLQFLNWRPDLEDVGNAGLSVADNVYHQPEGYKELNAYTDAATGTVTSGGTLLSAYAVQSVQLTNDDTSTQPAGQYLTATLTFATATAGSLARLRLIESNSGSDLSTTLTQSATLTGFGTQMAITSFSTFQYDDKIFVVAQAEVEVGAVATAINATGYITYDPNSP